MCSSDLHVHLDRILNRPQRLIFEAVGSAVPELEHSVGRVDDGRRIAASLFTFDAGGELLADDRVRKAYLGM